MVSELANDSIRKVSSYIRPQNSRVLSTYNAAEQTVVRQNGSTLPIIEDALRLVQFSENTEFTQEERDAFILNLGIVVGAVLNETSGLHDVQRAQKEEFLMGLRG